MKTSSLSRRAILAVLLMELLCAVAFVFTALLHERQTRLEALDATIRGRADSLIGAVQDAEDPADNVMIDPAEFAPPPTDVYAVYNQGGRLLGASREAQDTLITRGRDGFTDIAVCHHRYRVFQRDALRIIDRTETAGVGLRRPVTIVYAVRTDHMWHEIFEAAQFYVVLSLGLLCITAIVLIFLLQRLLEPIKALAVQAGGITASELSFVPPPSALRLRELKPLALALSDTVARLRQAFELEHRFISDAAHELKTAVAVVRSTIQVLSMRQRAPEEYQHGLDKLLTDNERVEELVSQMLTLARFQESREFPSEATELSESVQQTLKSVASIAAAHEVVLKPVLTPGVRIPLSAEAAQILVSNLVINAIQHSPSQFEVTVTVRLQKDDKRPAILEVRDLGTGIAAENLPHIFERFFREDQSRSRKTGGVGLGLAICKTIVEAADGTIEIKSVAGKGTTVTAAFRLA